LRDISDIGILEKLGQSARIHSIGCSSQNTYDVGVRRFLSYLDITQQSILTLVQSNTLIPAMIPYVSYLFIIEKLASATIKTYLAGLQFYLFSNDYISTSIWSPRLHQCLKGFFLQESIEKPLSKKFKLPFTLSMIFWARDNILCRAQDQFIKSALFSALCVGFMFLFRKSEYLTSSNRIPKSSRGIISTLLAKNTHFWFDEESYAASGPFPIQFVPSMMSIYLPLSKGDPYGKGATRFFPGDLSNPHCLVRLVFAYIKYAKLTPECPLFAGLRFVVTPAHISQMVKLTAWSCGLEAHRFTPHSLRVGGLVTLFAANVPDNLKQLAGRWANPKSFITYARATLQQFAQIANTLNNPSLVTASHVKKFYMHD
jgi:hypothetical protein